MINSAVTVNSLITYYLKKFKERFNRQQVVNRNKVKYQIKDMLEDLTELEVRELIDYYLRVEKEPTLSSFCYEYDELLQQKEMEVEDIKVRKVLLNETARAVKEFRERYSKE